MKNRDTNFLQKYIQENYHLLTEAGPLLIFGIPAAAWVKGMIIGYGGRSAVKSVIAAYATWDMVPTLFGSGKAHAPGRGTPLVAPETSIGAHLIQNFVTVASGKSQIALTNKAEGNLGDYLHDLNNAYHQSSVQPHHAEYGQDHTESYHSFLMSRLGRDDFFYFTQNMHPWLKFSAGPTDEQGRLKGGVWYIDEKGFYYSILRDSVFQILRGPTARKFNNSGVTYDSVSKRFYQAKLEVWDKKYPGGLYQKFGKRKGTGGAIELDTVYKVGFRGLKGFDAVGEFLMEYEWASHSSEHSEGIDHGNLDSKDIKCRRSWKNCYKDENNKDNLLDVEEFYSLQNWEISGESGETGELENLVNFVPDMLKRELKLLLHGSDFDGQRPSANLASTSVEEIRKIPWNKIISDYWKALERRLKKQKKDLPSWMKQINTAEKGPTMSSADSPRNDLDIKLFQPSGGDQRSIPTIALKKALNLVNTIYPDSAQEDKNKRKTGPYLRKYIDTQDQAVTRDEERYKLSGSKKRSRLQGQIEKTKQELEKQRNKFPARAQGDSPPSARVRNFRESNDPKASTWPFTFNDERDEVFQGYLSESNIKMIREVITLLFKSDIDNPNLSEENRKEILDSREAILKLKDLNIKISRKQFQQELDKMKSNESVLKQELPRVLSYVKTLIEPEENLADLVGEQKRISKSKKKSKNYPKPPKPLKDLGIGINNGLAIRIVKFENFALMYRAKMDLSDSVRGKEIGFWDLKGQPVAYLWMGSIHFHTLDNGQFPEKAMQLEDSFKKSSAYTRALQMKLKMPKVHKDHEAELKAIKAKSDNIKPPFERADHEIENGASPVPFALVHRGKTPGFRTKSGRPGKKFTYDYQVLSNKELTIIMFTGKNPFSEKKNLLYSKATGKPIGFITRDNQAHIHSPMSGFPQIDKIGMQFIASLPTSPSKGKEADIRNQRPQIPADLQKVLPPPRRNIDALGGPKKSVKSTPARATKSKKRRVIPPPPIAPVGKNIKKQATDAKAADSEKINKSAVTQPVTNFLTQKESQAALTAAKNKPEQGYSKNQLKIIQKRLNRDHKIPPLSRIQGNLNKLGYFEGETKTFATERFTNLEEQARDKIRIGDNKYGDETYGAIKKLQTALVARGFLKPIKDDGEYTNIDGLYGPNTHEAYKSAIKHSMFLKSGRIQGLEQEKKGQLIQNLKNLIQNPETELQKTWIAWMLRLLEDKKAKKSETEKKGIVPPENTRENADAALKVAGKSIEKKAKAGKINLKRSPYKGSHEVDWPLWLKIQHMYGNLQLDTKNGVLKTPKPTRQYVELYFAQIEKRGESFRVEPQGRLKGWKPSDKEIETNLGFLVRKYTAPDNSSGINVKELFIATAALNVPALEKVGKSPKGSSGRNLPIYDKNGKGVGWLIGGRIPNFGNLKPNTAEFIDPEVKKNIPVAEVSETSKNLKFEKIFEDYIRKNERKVKKCV